MIHMLQTDVLQMVFILIIFLMQRKNSRLNIKLHNVLIVMIMDIVQSTANDTQDVENAARSTTLENAQILLYTAFNAKACMKLGTLSVQRSLRRKIGWKNQWETHPVY